VLDFIISLRSNKIGMEQNYLHEILKEHMELKGLSIERLSAITQIPERFLEGLLEGDVSKLPPLPYVRGYLIRIAPLLDFHSQELWEIYKKEQNLERSGAEDKLPTNRFAIKPINKKYVVGFILAALFVVYLGWNISHLLGQPELKITSPPAQTTITSEDTINLLGYIDPADKLLINNEEVAIDESGAFEKAYSLQAGLNTIEFLAERFLGKETMVIKQVIYQPQQNGY